VPQEALVDAAVWYTQLDQCEPAQILESRLYEVIRAPEAPAASAPDFLAELASAAPPPGGGSAAAHTAAAAAALVAMVGRVTVGKKKFAAVEAQMWPLIEQADGLRARLVSAVDEDSASFMGFISATKLPKETPEQIEARDRAMEAATLESARVPFETVKLAYAVAVLAATAAELGNLNAISDAASAFHLASAAIQSAGLNILVNVKNLADPAPAAAWVKGLHDYEHKATQLEKKLTEILKTRAEIDLD
jgi:glutamate formiminotransferase/formiminotetrahydrofolate cyclodeaminase